MLTRRGRLLLVLGGALYVAAWAFGSQPLYPVAIGFLLAVLVSAAERARRRAPDGVPAPLATRSSTWRATTSCSTSSSSRASPLGLASVTRRRAVRTARRAPDPAAAGRPVPARPLRARGRFRAAATRSTRQPRSSRTRSGSSRAASPLARAGRAPRAPADRRARPCSSRRAGRAPHDGRRLLLRRPSGFDVHSVREYEEGESLRKVHWKSTARRGQLMVKELQDEPRDEVAILLDADAHSVAGDSFDAQVRAAGSLLRTQALRDRRAVLVVNSLRQEVVRVQTALGEWRQALETLAAVEPDRPGAARARCSSTTPAPRPGRSSSLVVTSRLDAALVDRVVHRSLAQRRVSVVYVDAPTFAGGRASREPGLLRLQASGVPVAVVRRGDDLRFVLGAAMSGRRRVRRTAALGVARRPRDRLELAPARARRGDVEHLPAGRSRSASCPPCSRAGGCGSRPSRSRRSSGSTTRSGPPRPARRGAGSSTASTSTTTCRCRSERRDTRSCTGSSSSRSWASPSRSRSPSPSAARCSRPGCSWRAPPGRRRCSPARTRSAAAR